MGEPLEAVEGSDSEISRLFPKCRPRSANHTPTTTPIDTRRSDLNLNCVLDSDDNENYDTEHTTGDIPRIYDNSKLSRDSGSSGRMSVDSGSGSRSGSTPGSRSGSTPGSHSESIKMERSAEDVDMDMDVSVVSAYDDYDERYMRSSVLDSSYEEAPPPPPASRTQAPRREHFRLRDSRIEIAGGREVFSHSRSRPARRRHDESQRRGGQQSHRQQYQQDKQQQQEQQWPESPGDSEGHGRSSSVVESPLVYETRLAGSSEVVFDDIGEWVARGLTVRALDDRPGSPSSPTADRQGDHAELGDQGYLAAYERSTSPSDSDSTQGSPQKVTKIGNVPIAEYEGSPRRYGPRPSPRTHSPRGNHHGPPPRPPRPGFPRRVLAEDEVAREATKEPLPSGEGTAAAQLGPDEEEAVAPLEDTTSDPPPPDSCSEAESVSPAPPVIAISTLTSSYSNQTSEPEPNAVDSDMYDYSYEMSETRKVLEEFFKEQGGREDEFLDLEYHLKRQQGNSYVGLRLAAEHSEGQAVAEGNGQQLDQGVSNSDLDPNKNDPEQNSGTDNANDSSDQHINVSEQQCRSSEQQHVNGSPPAVNADHESEHNTSNYEVSTSSPLLHNYQHDLSYEAQQETAQDHTLEIMSNCSNDSISSTNSGVGGTQENLQDDVSENLQDFNENNGLYDKLNEVVAAALSRENFTDNRSVEDHPSSRSCPEDLPSQDDPGILDISTEGDHDTASTNPETEDLPDTEVGLQQVGHSRNFTLSPETTSCDSGEVESECSGMDPEGSIHSSSRGLCTAMPVLEDGLSSGDESGMGEPDEEETKDVIYEETSEVYQQQQQQQQQQSPQQQQQQQEQQALQQQQQRPMVRSLDDQLCRGELPPPNPLPMLNSHNSPLPNAASSPHAKVRSRNSPHTNNTQSPSSSTLTLMKKQITEIEREIALRRPEGGPRRCGLDGDGPQPHLDLHLLDPLNEKVAEPPPPPAPHPHRGASSGKSQVVENGSSSSTPNQMPTTAVSPTHVLGHLHSPQYTPVSGPSTGPHLLSAMGSLTSPVQHKVAPHMVPGHPASHDILHNPGGGVSQSRESVEAAIADIKQAIRRTKNLPIKSHPQDRSPINDKAPVWIPRNNSSRRETQPPPLQVQQQGQQPASGQQSQPQSPQTPQQQQQQQQQQQAAEQQQLEAAVAEATRSPEHVPHEDGEWRRRPLHAHQDDGDTDQETDRLLGQQRSDDPGFYDEKGWRRPKTRTVLPRAANHKANGGGATSNGSTPSTPSGQSHQVSANQTPSSPPDMATTNKNKNKKEKETNKKKGRSKEVLIEGVLFRARYLGSTQLVSEGQPTKTTRMMQAEEAVSRIKAPDGETQPSTEVDLFISTEKIMVLNTDLKEIMMDHALRTISYIADIGDLVVLMARRRVLPTDDTGNNIQKTPKMICHVFESDEAQFIAQSIGQAFQVAYLEFLKANGIEDHSFVKEMDYQEVLNSQEIFGDELQMFAKKELQKEELYISKTVVVPKMKSEILGVVVVESGWGSMVPTVVIANLSPTGAAAKCGQLNIGDQIIAINGVSLVGLPLSTCQNYIKNTKYNTAVKLTVVPCPPVVEVKIRRPDTKYQLGFSVQNGVICSLLRGGIAERGGVRVGHRIIDINSQSVVAVPHEKIVNLLATSVGEIRMKTMPTSIFRLLTGQETPQYI
ncbi:uncharacterized protein LOC135224319 isoform X13 [Macrobrachium nipponense]|uniref:uncharacterized protein LOC135224319 isoform X13 n=1 Tax=Macrobrachium nipponense TaxID=159736 RepID=UPI0030C7C2F2